MTARPTRITTVMDAVRTQVAGRTYPPGTRLPSVRAQARTLGVSVSTVVEAYERLVAEALIVARPGSGFYVRGPAAPLALSALGPPVDRAIDPLWISRQALDAGADVLKPGCGWLPADWMFEGGMRRALRATARADTALLADYAVPMGLPALRQLLARRLAAADVEASPEQIMLTESGTQAIDLICRFFLAPGDTVLVDDPCYFNFHALLKAHRVNVVAVPYTPHGPDIAAFETALRAHQPRLYLTNSGLHNPTGASLSPITAHRLLKLAEDAGLVIVEDDIFADFEQTAAPRLAAFDGLSRVIQIGSFSKSVSASLRCGYLAAHPDWIAGLIDLRIATGFGGSQLAAALLLATLTDSGLRRHMDKIRLRLSLAMTRTIARLETLGIQPWLVPSAGMFVWCRLPSNTDAAAIARACLRAGVVMAPGNAFSPSQSARSYLRFNVAQCEHPRVFEVLASALASSPP